jgi:acetyl esterase/lipase
MTEQATAGLEVPARVIPTPRTVSAEAQAFLSRGLPITPPSIHHTDKEGWRAYIAAITAPVTQSSQMRAAPYPAQIAEHRLSEVALYEVSPESFEASHEDKVILSIHGGAFIMGGGIACAYIAQPLASLTGLRAYAVDYRMPPDHPFPAGLDDCVEAYRWLLDRYEPQKIALEGGSAGANLVAATILRARD